MPDAPAQLTFRSWLRRGMASQQSLQAPTDARASVKIDVTVSGISPNPSAVLALYGPGDVRGLSPNGIVRTWPKAGARNAEANYFPLIEFDQADLPWRYSPQANKTNLVKPWLCLVVIEAGKSRVFPPAPAQPLGILNVDASLLPDLGESDLWAHAQLHGPDIADDIALAASLDNRPEYFVSRILSTSILAPEIEYTAYLVPTFELGRRAGLGIALDGAGGLDPAWTAGSGSVSLPIYYQWSFATGPIGDFASLVRKILPKPLAQGVGYRSMDVGDPGLGLPSASDSALPVDGALKRYPPEASPDWSGATKDFFVQQLVTLLNKPAELFKTDPSHPLVTPPLRGSWQAAQPEVSPTSPAWFQTLNLDPRARVQAGAATQAVQREQQELLAGAWDQVGAVQAANERARWTQLAVEISSRLYQKALVSIAPEQTDTLFKFASPVLSRVLGSPQTIAQYLRQSPVSPGTLSAQFRRITRPRGPIAQRQLRPATTPSLLERMNQGTFLPAPPPPVPSGVNTFSHLGAQLVPSWLTPNLLDLLKRLPLILVILGIVLFAVGLILFVTIGAAAGVALLAVAAAAIVGSVVTRRYVQNLEDRVALRDGSLTGAALRNISIPSSFVPALYTVGASTSVPAATGPATPTVAAEFVSAAANVLHNLAVRPFQPQPLTPVSFTSLRANLMTQLDPRTALSQLYQSQLRISPYAYQVAGSSTGEVIAGPTFPKAFYDAVKAVSQDWILPGVDKAESNTAALVVTNQAAVEAFLVGANHEMSRTLLYNEYPTDLRFTYFRQFWDSATTPGAAAAPEDFMDIKPINTWGNTTLGANTARKEPPGQDDVVLFVRGEVLLRYPNTIVYAVKAVQNITNPKLPPLVLAPETAPNSQLFPSFQGSLDPDIRFFGFPLKVQDAISGDGWFFVLQQHPGEPIFGFDTESRTPLLTFKEATWDLVLGPGNKKLAIAANYLSFKNPSPAIQALISSLGPFTPNWGSSAAEVASNTLRRPTRVAYHAKKMLPT